MTDWQIFEMLMKNYDGKIPVEEYIEKLKNIVNEVYYQLKNQ
jgi:hypothetical protein